MMNKIDELIIGYCPNGVEYHPFSEVCKYVRGITYNKSQEVNDSEKDAYKILRANNITIPTNTLNFDDIKFVSPDVRVKEEQHLYEGDILICAGSGSRDHIGKVAYISESMDYVFGGFMAVIRCCDKLSSRFLFHVFTGSGFKKYLNDALNTSTINNLSFNVIKDFEIPVPPIEVQLNIVNFLDRFTGLVTELTMELTARKKQFEYYREKLLNFKRDMKKDPDNDVQSRVYGDSIIQLSSVSEYSRKRVDASILNEDNYIGVDNLLPGKQGKTKSTYVPISGRWAGFVPGDILVGNIRPYLKKIWFADVNGGTNGDVLVICPNKSLVNPKYLYYVISSDIFFAHDMQYSKGAKMPRGNKVKVMEFCFFLPDMEEQNRIVSILEKFDKLCNDFSEGIPAEIEARQKQYEYCRDKIFTLLKKAEA